jgi:hypothetical protein
MRLYDAVTAPKCDEVCVELAYLGGDPDECQRAYRVAGVEETRHPFRFRLLLERIEYETAVPNWSFYSIPEAAA